jgi:hypothetical protein
MATDAARKTGDRNGFKELQGLGLENQSRQNDDHEKQQHMIQKNDLPGSMFVAGGRFSGLLMLVRMGMFDDPAGIDVMEMPVGSIVIANQQNNRNQQEADGFLYVAE